MGFDEGRLHAAMRSTGAMSQVMAWLSNRTGSDQAATFDPFSSSLEQFGLGPQPSPLLTRAAWARLLKQCAEEAERDAATRSIRLLEAMFRHSGEVHPPPAAGAAAAVSPPASIPPAKDLYAAAVCVGWWGQALQARKSAEAEEEVLLSAIQWRLDAARPIVDKLDYAEEVLGDKAGPFGFLYGGAA